MTELLNLLFSIEKDFRFDPVKQKAGLEMLMDSLTGQVFVAAVDEDVVGMCTGQLVVSTAEGGFSVLVEDVVVRRPWQGRGIGKMLMQRVETWARNNGATRLQLLADRKNTGAIDFYNRMGWERTQLNCLRRTQKTTGEQSASEE